MGSISGDINTHLDGSIGSVGPVSVGGSLGAIGPVTVGGSLGAIGPVTVALTPTTFDINIDKLPKILIGVDPVTLHLDPIELRLTELPSIRGHLPADFNVGLSLLGIELLCVRLCGEAQIITEPYRPNPCENCGQAQPIKRLDNQTLSVPTLSVGEV